MKEYNRHNAMDEADDAARFRDCCSEFMGQLLDELATTPDRSRTFPEIEDAIGWPRRRIASVLGGAYQLRFREFGGLRPYHFYGHFVIGLPALFIGFFLLAPAFVLSNKELAAALESFKPRARRRVEDGTGSSARSKGKP